jgi:hypothetical protein
MDVKGQKNICNVKAQWVYTFALSKHFLFECKSLIVKMSENNPRPYKNQLWIILWLWHCFGFEMCLAHVGVGAKFVKDGPS